MKKFSRKLPQTHSKNVKDTIINLASDELSLKFSSAVKHDEIQISLYDFFVQAWNVLEPGTELVENWHLKTISAYLEAVYLGKIKRLIINVPPRTGKSTLATIVYPCWNWLHNPYSRLLCASYSQTLAYEHSGSRRLLINSELFKTLCENRIRLRDDKNRVQEFGNTFRGSMTATSMLGTVTGKGGYLIIDDPTSGTQANSNACREAANNAFKLNLSTRLNDKKKDPIILIQQRQHDNDLTGYLRANDSGFCYLILRGICEKTEYFPIVNDVILDGGEIDYSDKDNPLKFYKYEAGSLLNPLRESWDDVNKLKIDLGDAGFSAQIQQEPSPDKGAILSYAPFGVYAQSPNFDRFILSVDCTFKGAKTSDYVEILGIGEVIDPIIVNGITVNNSKYYIFSEWREQADFNRTEQAILELISSLKPHKVIIEDKANGPAIINRLSSNPLIRYLLEAYNVGRDSKESRAEAIKPILNQSRIKVPVNAYSTQFDGLTVEQVLSLIGVEFKDIKEKDTPFLYFVPDFLTEINRFPVAKYDDRVDALTQGITWLEANPIKQGSGVKPWQT